MFESLRNVENWRQKAALVGLAETRTRDYFPETEGERPKEEHFRGYVRMLERNYAVLESYASEFGWPAVDKLIELGLSEEDALGVEAAAFLCVQHLDANIVPRLKANGIEDASKWQETLIEERVLARQAQMLEIMAEQNANKGFHSYLTDRHERDSGRPQIFGTQFAINPLGIEVEIKLPNGEVTSLESAKNDEDFLARRNENGLAADIESLNSIEPNPLSFIKEIKEQFPVYAKDPRINSLKQDLTEVKTPLTQPNPHYMNPTVSSILKQKGDNTGKAGKHDKKFQDLIKEQRVKEEGKDFNR